MKKSFTSNLLWSLLILVGLLPSLFSCTVQTYSSQKSPLAIPMPVYSPLRATVDIPEARYRYVPSSLAISESVFGLKCTQIERNYFRVMTRFKSENFVSQKTDNDCWAACTAMLLNHEFGKNSSHSEIRERVADLHMQSTMANELEMYLNMVNNRIGIVHAKPAGTLPIASALIQNHPMLAGLEYLDNKDGSGHVYVLVGYDFSVGVFPFGSGITPEPAPSPIFDKFYLIDPSAKSFELLEMPAEEFIKRVAFVMAFYDIHNSALNRVTYNVGGDLMEYIRFKAACYVKSDKTPDSKGAPAEISSGANGKETINNNPINDILGKWRGKFSVTNHQGKVYYYFINYEIYDNPGNPGERLFREKSEMFFDDATSIDSCTKKKASLFLFEGRIIQKEHGLAFERTKSHDPKCGTLHTHFFEFSGSDLKVIDSVNGRPSAGVLKKIE